MMDVIFPNRTVVGLTLLLCIMPNKRKKSKDTEQKKKNNTKSKELEDKENPTGLQILTQISIQEQTKLMEETKEKDPLTSLPIVTQIGEDKQKKLVEEAKEKESKTIHSDMTLTETKTDDKVYYAIEIKKRKPEITTDPIAVEEFKKRHKSYYIGFKMFRDKTKADIFVNNYKVDKEGTPPVSPYPNSPTSNGSKLDNLILRKGCTGKFIGYICSELFGVNLCFVWRFLDNRGGEKWNFNYGACSFGVSTYTELEDDEKFTSVLDKDPNKDKIERAMSFMTATPMKKPGGDGEEILTVRSQKKGQTDPKDYKVYLMYTYYPKTSDNKKVWLDDFKIVTTGMQKICGTTEFMKAAEVKYTEKQWVKMKGKKSTIWTDLQTASCRVYQDNNLHDLFIDSDYEKISPVLFGAEEPMKAEAELHGLYEDGFII